MFGLPNIERVAAQHGFRAGTGKHAGGEERDARDALLRVFGHGPVEDTVGDIGVVGFMVVGHEAAAGLPEQLCHPKESIIVVLVCQARPALNAKGKPDVRERNDDNIHHP